MLKVQRLLSDLRAAQSAAPLSSTPLRPKGPRWPDWEVKEMVYLRREGLTAKQIARRLRRTKAAVERQLHNVKHGKRKIK